MDSVTPGSGEFAVRMAVPFPPLPNARCNAAASSRPDQAARLAILSEIWAEDGVYVDPEVPDGVRGPAALSDLITTSLDEMPGLEIKATTALVVLGDRGWYRWEAATADGEAFDGIDFVEFDAEGRIERLTNFYDA